MLLKYKADRRTLAFVAFYFALVALQWIVAPSNPWIAVPLIVLTCWFSWFCAVITHNTIHCPIFESRKLNKVFQVVLTLTYGHPVSSYVSGHNLSHHKHTQKSADIMRTTKVRYRWNLLNMLLFFPTVAGAVTKGDVDFARTMRKQRPRWFKQMMIELSALIAVSAVLLVLDWQKFLLYFLLPHMYAAWGIISMNFLQHDGCDEDSEFNHSRNFTGHFFGWWTFNNGFHTIHHMKPSLHWSLLREAHNREVKPYMHPELDQKSIALYCFKAYIWPGKRVRYDGMPIELPPPEADSSWIPDLNKKVDASLGAES